MRDNCCYDEITMLSEDRVSTGVPSVYTRINNNPDDTRSEDPFDAENERHYGFSRDNPHVINTTTNVVVLPSFNKWNCFSIRDRKIVDVIGSRDNMNTATSISPTSTLEINNLFSEKVTDYPAQTGSTSANDLTRNNSGYRRRLTLREKLAKQRSESGNDSKNDTSVEEPHRLTKVTSLEGASTPSTNYYRPTTRSQSNDSRNDSSSEGTHRLTKATSLGGASTPSTNYHRPPTRSQSNNDAITEERRVFGFKIMKGGLQSSSDSQNNNSTGFTRHGSSRQPVRATHYSTTNRFRDKAGSALFYAPKNNRVSDAKSEGAAKPERRDSVKGRDDSVSSEKNVDVMTEDSSQDVVKKSYGTVEKPNKGNSNIDKTTVRKNLSVDNERIRNLDVKDVASGSKKSGSKRDDDENNDSKVFRVSKEIKVKNEEGKTQKLLIRAESLREGKSRLEEFREKQRRGKLTRSLTNPDFQQSEDTEPSKDKNISESLEEIRKRIRERRRKREKLQKSQSMPETESPPKMEGEENTKELSNDTKDNIKKHKEVKQSKEIKGDEENIKELSDDTKDNIRKNKEVELSKEGNENSKNSKGSSLNELEYLEIEESSEMSCNESDRNMTVVDTRCEDVIEKEHSSEEVIRTKTKEVKSKDTENKDVEVKDTCKQKDLKTMDKEDSKSKESDKEISDGKKIELKEILSNEQEESQTQKESTDAKTEVKTSLSNTTASTGEQSTSEVKKPTKRERRKRERYQRSKTMSAIMYNEISLDARREMQHKGSETKSEDKNGESIAMLSVSEMKKRFLEADSGSSKISELGLFYSGKTPASGKSSGIVKSSSRGKTVENGAVKDDSAASKGKSSETRSRTNLSRRHTLATGATFQNTGIDLQDNVAQEEDARTTLSKNTDSSITNKTKSTKTKAKIPLGRSHTLPSYTTDISEEKQNEDVHSSVSRTKKEIPVSGGRLPLRRHTFCSQTNFMISLHNPVKLSESVETLREKFSKGGAPVFNLATSSKGNSTKTVQNDADSYKRIRRRVVSDSSVQAKSITEKPKITKDENKESGSSLSRRHTIANRPTRQNSEKDQQERQEFPDKFLAKNDEIRESQKPEERKNTKDVESKTEERVQASRHGRKGKEFQLSISKIRKLFLGQASNNEKKTKLRERRAKTIAGGISPEIMKEIGNKGTSDISNKHVVKPDIYVTDTAKKETKEPERRRRSSDLNPDSYLSSKPLSPEETGKDSVFNEEKLSQDKVQPNKISNDIKTPTETRPSEFNSGRRRSVSDSDTNIPSNVSARENAQVSSDVIDLKTPTDTNLFNSARRCSGSESDMNKASDLSAKDQNLNDYLTSAIKTMAGSPKSQRTSPQKGKFTASQSFDKNETKQHLDVVKTNLSMHSWSTSDLDKIFHGSDGVRSSASQVDMSTMDFDEISGSTTRLQSLTEGRTKARPKRTSSKSLNPMKSLMERTDVRTHTEEPEEENKTTSGFEKAKKRSSPRKKRSQLEPWRRHTLDPVALAGLASREDFSRVSLRKTKGPGKEKDEYDGSLPVMLIQIKGRRQVQTRLVEPSLSSLNTGDCFILITPKELFCWIGQHANTIEKAKAVEISSKIQKRGDMNCKTGDVLYIDETKQGNTLAYRKFCKILEGDTDFPIEDAKLCTDDEFYEREVISTNKVYKLQEGDPPHLIPVTELCGYMPMISILNTKEVFIFDFGSELYLWTGQQSLSNKRKVAFHLAEMLYKQQFDCDGVVSPIDPRRPMKRSQSGSKPVYHDADGKECRRPTWTLFARLHEKAETLLFQEKFFDWPDPTKIIKMKGHVSSGEIAERPPPIELKPCDPTEMQKPATDLEPAILEATNLGRGLGTSNIEVNGEVKEGDLVTTLGMTVWLVTQNKHFVLPKASEGHFHSGDGYVIRWVYFVAKKRTVRDKRGRIRPLTGRQRCAYFFWQGNECSVNEKGAAAIMAVELDEEHGPQIRVVEGKEPPHFLKLFDGAMVIHSGKRIRVSEEQDEFSDKSSVRMYCIRNEDISEGYLVQVKRSASSLRSRSSSVVVDSEQGNIFVWHGCKTTEYHRKSAEKAANFIKERHPVEMNLSEETSVTVTDIEEGHESDLFWSTVGGKKNNYLSLLRDPSNYDFCPRLFHTSSSTGQFTSTEILSPSRYPGRTCPFPVVQDDLYSASQPATFLLDVGDEVYVWEGWMPAEITKDKRGSAKRRWDEERKLTLQTTLSYIEEASERIKKGGHVVQAGLEPLSFTTRFPFWNRSQNIAEMQKMEGRKDFENKSVEEALDAFTKKYYSFQELTSDNPPDGVDPSKLEAYLTDEEFQKIFEMSCDLFSQLPGWKQDILKKALGLF